MKRLACLTLLLLASLPAFALEVRQVIWGFDGQVVPGRFNLLSVSVVNETGAVYEGALILNKTDGLGRKLGADLVQPCFLAPYTARWVQFYPFITSEHDEWVLAWGRGLRERMELVKPRPGPPARVLLTDPDSPLAAASKLSAFPHNLFPPTVTATDSLASLIIDEMPRWEPVRRRALLDWLRRGGTLHILYGSDGKYPEFPESLRELNVPAARFRVGAGLVVRHPVTRREMSEGLLAGRGFPALELKRGQDATMGRLEDLFFQHLKALTRPEHNWLLIYLMIGAYIVLLGPLNYLAGRKLLDHRLAILFFLVLVGGFGFGFSVVGRRGYGETTAVNTLSYARLLEGDTYDVTQWVNAFVTSGDEYTISHAAAHNLYSTCQEFEAVRGIIQNGKNGRFVVDIPLYSSRAFLHRGKMEGPDLGLAVVKWESPGSLRAPSFSFGPHFPQEVLEMWALFKGRICLMTVRDNLIQMGSAGSFSVSKFLDVDPLLKEGYYYGRRFGYDDTEAENPRVVFGKLARPLIAQSIGGSERFPFPLPARPASSDCVQLFIFAKSPEGFCIGESRFRSETGYALYHIDLFRPES